MTGVRSGCLLQAVAVSPGERYVVSAWMRQRGTGAAAVRVRWQTPEGKWHAESLDRLLGAPASEDEWRQAVGLVTVPEGAGKLLVLLLADGQRGEDHVIWWDDVVVFRAD